MGNQLAPEELIQTSEAQSSAGSKTASDALRQEYFVAAAGSSTQENDSKQVQAVPESRASELRKIEEALDFKQRYDRENFSLDPIKPGQGPFQTLEQMSKEHKIELSPEQIHAESIRIRDRDFKDWGRDYYSTTDTTKRWTDQEIEQRVNESVSKVKGIDVSAHQGDINWKLVKDAGYQFAFLKATEGGDWIDAKFAANRLGARDAGLKVGYYHFFRPPRPVEDQIKNFVSTVGKIEPDALRIVIDTEDERLWKPYNLEQRIKMIKQWCDGVEKELGIKPSIMIYGSPNFFTKVLQNSPQLGAYDLWIANYNNAAEPIVPKPWTKWTYWQYSETGKVPGINSEHVDLNMYNGTNINDDGSVSSMRPRHRGRRK